MEDLGHRPIGGLGVIQSPWLPDIKKALGVADSDVEPLVLCKELD